MLIIFSILLHSDCFVLLKSMLLIREVSCFQNCVFKYLGSKLQFLWTTLLLNSKCHFKSHF